MALCSKPFHRAYGSFGCGQCMLCRINRRRVWTHRLLLEAQSHDESSFLTLTYDDPHLPEGGTLVPRHLQLFLKLLRRNTSERLRFFGVGEYGEEAERPHYHVAVFGAGFEPGLLERGADHILSRCWSESARAVRENPQLVPGCRGNVHVGELTRESAQYICGYTVKKLTNPNNENTRQWLAGRHPEFMRCSQGIGKQAADELGDQLTTVPFAQYSIQRGDVILKSAIEGKPMPLGRYMKARIRSAAGLSEELCKPARQVDAQARRHAEIMKLQDDGFTFSQADKILSERSAQRVLNSESRLKTRIQHRRKL